MLERTSRPEPEFEPLGWPTTQPKVILERIESAGIVGMGGAGFPTATKLRSGLRYGVQHVVANGVECEPGVNADRALLRNHLTDVLEGLRIVGQCVDCANLTLAVSDARVYDALERLEVDDIACERVANDPANGDERVLLGILFDAAIPQARYPSQLGYIVLNVATLFAICEAVRDGVRPQDRIVSAFDAETWVRSGTRLSELTTDSARLRLGSEATGFVAHASDVVTLTTNAIARDAPDGPRACIHCGWCDDVCPRTLPVEELLRTSQEPDGEPALAQEFDACFECGACVVACPSKIPLLDWLRHGKQQIAIARRNRNAEARFERHSERQALEQQREHSIRASRIRTQRQW